MNEKGNHGRKLPKATVIICAIAILFAAISIQSANSMRITAENMYKHPYTVTNTARGIRSRLLDMKRSVGIVLTKNFEGEENIRELFEDRYDIQNEAIDTIYECYSGSLEDVDVLRKAMDDLIAVQKEAIEYAGKYSEEERMAYIEEEIYPYYDVVSESLDTIIAYSDAKIYSLTEKSRRTAILSEVTAFLLTVFIVFLTLYSNRMERKGIEELTIREGELRDVLLLAQKSNNAKKDFLSRMSHEIRTPMNVIIGMTTIAGTHLDDRSRMEDCLSKIAFSSRHLLSLINDVLDMSRIEEGKMTVSYEPFRLQQLTDSVISIVYSQSKGQGKVFECDVDGVTQEMFIGDLMRVNQILLNLLSNSVKFTPPGGKIRLEIRQSNRNKGKTCLQFLVSDTGIGMSEEFLERLFLPFEQADSKISQKYGGTGLGMAITHNLVQLLGGTIHVKSRLGEGTTFTVELPFDIPKEIKDKEKWKLDTLKVLVVDDDEDTCTYTGLLFERMGIIAQGVKSGLEAVQIVLDAHDAGEDYDVCLIDWQMPDIDGVEITRRIRQKIGPDTLIIIISAYDWCEIEEEARRAGANAFISKPLFESTLYDTLLSALGSKSSMEKETEVLPDSWGGKRFLLVEDNELNREIAVELLKITGAEIDCAGDGKEAVDRFLSSPAGYFDLILMDVQMPVMDGYTATKQIRASSHPDADTVAVVAMTANTFSTDVDAAYTCGMNGHIAKPVEVKALYETIDRLIKT